MKALVETARIQFGEPLFRLHHHLQRHLFIGLLLHHAMMQDELVLVFKDAHLDSQLHWNTGFAFTDPFGVRLKDGEHLLVMRDDPALNDTASDLVDLAIRMLHEAFNLKLLHNIKCLSKPLVLDQDERLACLAQVLLCDSQILLVRPHDQSRIFFLLLGRSGLAAFLVLCRAHEAFDVPNVVGVLAPITDATALAPLCGERDDLAHRIQQQVDVGGVVHIAIDHSEFTHLSADKQARAVQIMQSEGMNATVSSIHINGWFGAHNKLAGARWIVRELLGRDLDAEIDQWIYVGDSTNDQLMFAHFPHSIGVANIRRFEAMLAHKPRYVTEAGRGAGFAEVARAILASKPSAA